MTPDEVAVEVWNKQSGKGIPVPRLMVKAINVYCERNGVPQLRAANTALAERVAALEKAIQASADLANVARFLNTADQAEALRRIGGLYEACGIRPAGGEGGGG